MPTPGLLSGSDAVKERVGRRLPRLRPLSKAVTARGAVLSGKGERLRRTTLHDFCVQALAVQRPTREHGGNHRILNATLVGRTTICPEDYPHASDPVSS